METIIYALLICGLFYYAYIMLPYWFRQGYHQKKKATSKYVRPTVPSFQKEFTLDAPAPVMLPDLTTDNKTKGDAFEKYIVSLFDKESGRFRLLNWSSDKRADNGVYAISNHHPDLEWAFVDDRRTYRFAVECKWRKEFKEGKLDWAKRYQIENYHAFQKKEKMPVFVAIGVGGTPDAPAALYVTTLDNASAYPIIFESFLKQYKRNPNHRFFYNPVQKLLY